MNPSSAYPPQHIESGETAEPIPVEPRTRWQRAAAEARTTSRIQGEEFFTRVWPEEQHTPPSSPGKWLSRKREELNEIETKE
ncbi:hypothetical protein E2C01_027373 [Portunus trituberculatus]|uniref:Uncharacterized protein n=1 Tax=Portunus trituberculatus TaxID=210409 RepID=A0A5B7EIJ9_PORTR|nr:hypothetical protein [Portunus trituberculatus]